MHRVNSLSDFINDDEDDLLHNTEFFPASSGLKKLPPKEKEDFLQLCKEMDGEKPTIEKIMKSNITQNDKKFCLRLYEQMSCAEDTNSEYFRLIDNINEILYKGKIYTVEEIRFFEEEENKLKNMRASNDTLKTKILKLEADDKIKAKILSMHEEMLTYPTDSTTYSSLREEIEWSIRLPYQKREVESYVSMNNTELNHFYCDVRRMLDEELYGMNKVKERILHVLNDRRSSGDSCGRNIVIAGNVGVGKSAICKVLAKILNKKFAKISAAALDSAAIKGSNKVYLGSEPSMILQILAELKTNNALIMIDEVDKVDKKCQHALLHVSDASDNREFQDNYLKNFSHDLSKIMFVFTLNDIKELDPALLDRFDIIYVDDYTNEEKLQIFKNYMLPKTLLNLGMKKNDIIVSDLAIKKLLEEKNIGLRSIDKIIKDIVGKVNMYRNSILPDGTLGNFSLSYEIKNFKFPLKIDYKLLTELLS
jgi:ATP-dependent Lon protease